MNYKYKGREYTIEVCDNKDWGEHMGWFRVMNEKPFDIKYAQSYEELIIEIEKSHNNYYDFIPSSKKEWIRRFESCIVRTSYEDWHTNKIAAMELLELYKQVTS